MPNGLHCHDISSNNIISEKITNYTFLNIVAASKKKYTTREVAGSDTTLNFNKKLDTSDPSVISDSLRPTIFETAPSLGRISSAPMNGYDTYYLQGNTTRRYFMHRFILRSGDSLPPHHF